MEQLVIEGGDIKGVMVNGQVMTADRYVLAFGSYSRDLLKPLKVDVPRYPVKGYSLTVLIVAMQTLRHNQRC